MCWPMSWSRSARTLSSSCSSAGCEVKIDRALDQYSRGGMSFGAAAERAGVSQSDLARYAYARGLQPSFSRESLAEELADS